MESARYKDARWLYRGSVSSSACRGKGDATRRNTAACKPACDVLRWAEFMNLGVQLDKMILPPLYRS